MNMGIVDYIIIGAYLAVLAGISVHHARKTGSASDFFVGNGRMSPGHVGLSVAATDVGGGFSIGLGGLAFGMGLSASWLLFTGFLGALLAAVLVIPRVKFFQTQTELLTYPDLLRHRFGKPVALAAALISLVGYTGFTGSQLLAGSKLATAVFPSLNPTILVLLMAGLVVAYTSFGGIRAVVATDSFQWLVLCGGLLGVVLPLSYSILGGWSGLQAALPAEFFSLSNIKLSTFVNWMVTIVPIWFVAMTLYQRIYALKGEKEAKRAWMIAGLFEWPVLAFTGALLGLFARVAHDQGHFAVLGFEPGGAVAMDPEMGIPALIRTLVPTGLVGLVLMAYFSAVLSTADSCLLAASGNFVGDLSPQQRLAGQNDAKGFLRYSRRVTLGVGLVATALALIFDEVLALMLYSYSFMVGGLFVPTCYALFARKASMLSSGAGLSSILAGGSLTILMTLFGWKPLDLDPTLYGILLSWAVYVSVHYGQIKKVGG